MVQAIPELKANMAEGLPNAVGYGMNSIGDFTGALTSALGGKAKKAMADVLEKVAESKPASYIPYSEKLIRPAYRLRYADIKPETLAQQKLFEHITEEDLPKIEERGNAARRLGLSYLTPAELLLSPFEAAKQGTIGRTSAGSKLLQEKGGERFASEETAINTLLDNIYNSDKLAPEKQAAYDATMQNSVPPEFVEKWLKNENVKKAVHELETEPEYKQELGSVAKDSFEYWDHVKRVLADIEKGHMKPGKGTKQFKLASVTKTRNQMVDEMDKIVPEYENARKISERNFIRKDIERFFDKRKMTGNEFFKYIKSKENFNRLMQRLEPFPKAQQNLKDMHLLFEDLIPNKLSLKSSAALKRTSMSEARNKLDAEKMMLDELYGQAHDVAAVDLMTHPDLPRLIAEYLKNKQG
jgi:hypothetical protein